MTLKKIKEGLFTVGFRVATGQAKENKRLGICASLTTANHWCEIYSESGWWSIEILGEGFNRNGSPYGWFYSVSDQSDLSDMIADVRNRLGFVSRRKCGVWRSPPKRVDAKRELGGRIF